MVRTHFGVIQGLPLTTLANFEDVLCAVSILAMKGSLVIGEFPAWLAGTDLEQTVLAFCWHSRIKFILHHFFMNEHHLFSLPSQISLREWMHKLFMRHGFQVQMIDYEDVAKSLGRELSRETSSNMLFVAEHLRFSDDQVRAHNLVFRRQISFVGLNIITGFTSYPIDASCCVPCPHYNLSPNCSYH